MATVPPIVERCPTCGAELTAAAPFCWLCRTPRGKSVQYAGLPYAAPVVPPKFVLASNLFSYGIIFCGGLLVLLMCIGMVVDTQDNALPALIVGLVGGIPLLATLIRTVRRHRETGSASFLDTLLTLMAYSAIAVGFLTLLAFAAVGALVIWCFYALANNKF